jgi:hypothetical protein
MATKKKKSWKPGSSSGHITNLKQSVFLSFDICGLGAHRMNVVRAEAVANVCQIITKRVQILVKKSFFHNLKTFTLWQFIGGVIRLNVARANILAKDQNICQIIMPQKRPNFGKKSHLSPVMSRHSVHLNAVFNLRNGEAHDSLQKCPLLPDSTK